MNIVDDSFFEINVGLKIASGVSLLMSASVNIANWMIICQYLVVGLLLYYDSLLTVMIYLRP